MSSVASAPQTLDDLMRYPGKAELINGRVVPTMPSGVLPIRTAKRILRSLDEYVEQAAIGEAFGDALGYAPKAKMPSGRQSLCPDLSFFTGKLPGNLMKFIDAAPTFAVEVRSDGDYGPAADHEYDAKREDYFAAGTLVVWDVDPLARTVTSFRAADPHTPVTFRAGDTADAEPAVPGWRVKVDDLFS